MPITMGAATAAAESAPQPRQSFSTTSSVAMQSALPPRGGGVGVAYIGGGSYSGSVGNGGDGLGKQYRVKVKILSLTGITATTSAVSGLRRRSKKKKFAATAAGSSHYPPVVAFASFVVDNHSIRAKVKGERKGPGKYKVERMSRVPSLPLEERDARGGMVAKGVRWSPRSYLTANWGTCVPASAPEAEKAVASTKPVGGSGSVGGTDSNVTMPTNSEGSGEEAAPRAAAGGDNEEDGDGDGGGGAFNPSTVYLSSWLQPAVVGVPGGPASSSSVEDGNPARGVGYGGHHRFASAHEVVSINVGVMRGGQALHLGTTTFFVRGRETRGQKVELPIRVGEVVGFGKDPGVGAGGGAFDCEMGVGALGSGAAKAAAALALESPKKIVVKKQGLLKRFGGGGGGKQKGGATGSSNSSSSSPENGSFPDDPRKFGIAPDAVLNVIVDVKSLESVRMIALRKSLSELNNVAVRTTPSALGGVGVEHAPADRNRSLDSRIAGSAVALDPPLSSSSTGLVGNSSLVPHSQAPLPSAARSRSQSLSTSSVAAAAPPPLQHAGVSESEEDDCMAVWVPPASSFASVPPVEQASSAGMNGPLREMLTQDLLGSAVGSISHDSDPNVSASAVAARSALDITSPSAQPPGESNNANDGGYDEDDGTTSIVSSSAGTESPLFNSNTIHVLQISGGSAAGGASSSEDVSDGVCFPPTLVDLSYGEPSFMASAYEDIEVTTGVAGITVMSSPAAVAPTEREDYLVGGSGSVEEGGGGGEGGGRMESEKEDRHSPTKPSASSSADNDCDDTEPTTLGSTNSASVRHSGDNRSVTPDALDRDVGRNEEYDNDGSRKGRGDGVAAAAIAILSPRSAAPSTAESVLERASQGFCVSTSSNRRMNNFDDAFALPSGRGVISGIHSFDSTILSNLDLHESVGGARPSCRTGGGGRSAISCLRPMTGASYEEDYTANSLSVGGLHRGGDSGFLAAVRNESRIRSILASDDDEDDGILSDDDEGEGATVDLDGTTIGDDEEEEEEDDDDDDGSNTLTTDGAASIGADTIESLEAAKKTLIRYANRTGVSIDQLIDSEGTFHLGHHNRNGDGDEDGSTLLSTLGGKDDGSTVDGESTVTNDDGSTLISTLVEAEDRSFDGGDESSADGEEGSSIGGGSTFDDGSTYATNG